MWKIKQINERHVTMITGNVDSGRRRLADPNYDSEQKTRRSTSARLVYFVKIGTYILLSIRP